jgi:uncharacterized protein YhbP (UPF0306 family)
MQTLNFRSGRDLNILETADNFRLMLCSMNKTDRCQDMSAKGPITGTIKRNTEYSPFAGVSAKGEHSHRRGRRETALSWQQEIAWED